MITRKRIKQDARNVVSVLRQTSGSDSFRYIVETRHLLIAADCIDVLLDDIFKLERYCEKALINAEDIASGRASHLESEIEEYINEGR